MLHFSSITQGQTSYKTYMHPKNLYQLDTLFNPASKEFISSNTNHIWLNTLNSQYVDTTKNKMNPFAIPAYHEIKNRGLFGPHHIKKQMNAGLYYHPHFFPTIPYGMGPYNPTSQPYSALPYGYSSFSLKASGSPYYILPKF